MTDKPLCPHCSKPVINEGDVSAFEVHELATGVRKIPTIWMITCGKCQKIISCLTYESKIFK